MSTHAERETERIRQAGAARAEQMLAEHGPIPDHLLAPIRDRMAADAKKAQAAATQAPRTKRPA